MPRPLRILLSDLIYHVLNRGNNRQIVFVDDQDYLHYLEILKRYKERFNFKIFAYCLMTNHIHLLIKTSSGGTISQIMKAMTIAHTRHYHLKYTSSGHIWQGRFKSPIVSEDEYLLTLMRYIEQNPVRAGIVEHPEKYLYSSNHINVKIEQDKLVDKEENPVYLSLGNTMGDRAKAYKEFASVELDEDKLKMIRQTLGGQSHFTSQRSLAQIKEKLITQQKRSRGRPRVQRQ
jgi:putative transposase